MFNSRCRAVQRGISAVVIGAALLASVPTELRAADQWIEVKSAHFTVLSNASERSTRKLVWQLEQVRSAMAALWSWAKPDLNRPLSVIAVKDENSMRAIAPEYWEQRKTGRPASVWVTGPDQHYLAIRTDVEVDGKETINPYITAYFSYVGLVLNQSFDRDLPIWFQRGFTGVLSNTIVRDDFLLMGAPIPWQLQILRERPLLMLPKLLAVTRKSREMTEGTHSEVFDAESWAFVHFLMFGDEGKRANALNAYAKLVVAGKDPVAAFTETLGPPEALEGPFRGYIQRSIYSYARFNIDVSVERERFPVRQSSAGEVASSRALFHAVMRRPVESRASIAEARKADAASGTSYTAEALLLDLEGKVDEARVAYSKAVELGTASAYAHYRLASLKWQPQPSQDLLRELDGLLLKALDRNSRYAAAYAWLGEIRASLGQDGGEGLVRRAITLEPMESRHRMRAAYVLLRQGKAADARIEAQNALTLADDDASRREAQALVDRIAKAGAGQ